MTSRQDATVICTVAFTVSVQKTPDKFAKKSLKWKLEYGNTSTSQLRISVLASTGMAVFQLPFPTFFADLSGVLCTETVEATMPMAVESCVTSRLVFNFTAPSKLGQNTRDYAATAVISLAHSAVTYWSCFAIHKHLRHLKNVKL